MPGRSFRQHREEHGFGWATSNLRFESADALRQAGVSVYTSPNVPSEIRVIDLDDGHIEIFHEGESRPAQGWFAAYAGVAEHCLAHGRPLEEQEGFAIMQPHGSGRAGDPLAHGRPA